MPWYTRRMKARSRKAHKELLVQYAIMGALAVCILVLAYAVWGIARKEEIARKAVEERKAELAVLKERKAVYEANVAELSTDRGQEATLRQNHGVARAGEEVIIVVPPEEKTLGPKIPWYRRVLGFFGFW